MSKAAAFDKRKVACCFSLLCLLLLAGSGWATLADWTVEGDASQQQGAQLGYAVAPAGDVDGDGYADLLVGAPHHSGTVYREGAAFLYRGRPNGPEDEAAWTAGSGQQGALFGAAVAGAGDVNGDGYADVLVGAPAYKNEKTAAGAVFLYYGGPAGLSSLPGWQLVSEAAEPAALGVSVAGAGDVDGDGYADLLVGAGRQDGVVQDGGLALLFYGGPAGPGPAPDWQLAGAQAGAQLGLALAGAGDVDGDGYADLLLGVPYYDAAVHDGGLALLFYGGAGGPGTVADWQRPGTQAGAALGRALSGAGDVNGDGFADFLLGAPAFDGILPDAGRATLFLGSSAGPVAAAWQYTGDSAYAYAGSALAPAGDYNGDGYDDVLLGAPYYEDDQPQEGAAFLFLGWPYGLGQQPAWQATGDKAEAAFGFAVAGAGDVNGDGYADLLGGAPAYKRESVQVGRAFAYLGRPAAPPADPLIFLPLLRGGN